MSNEDLIPEPSAVYSEPDGCLYTWCGGDNEQHCGSEPGFVAFASERHFKPTELGQLTKVIDPYGRVLVENVRHPGVSTYGTVCRNEDEQQAFEDGYNDALADRPMANTVAMGLTLAQCYIHGYVMGSKRVS